MSSVSFVVPVFNKSLYLKHVVNSIISQKGDFDNLDDVLATVRIEGSF